MTSNRELPDEIKSADASSASAEDNAAMRARALEARQGINEIIFAALKMKGRNLTARSRSLPLTIIGGFLGSGKTTLPNHLLVSPHGRRLVVLVNDFGRINAVLGILPRIPRRPITTPKGWSCQTHSIT